MRSRERALLIAAELGFDGRIDDRAAIDRHKRLLAPGAQVMDCPSDEFLSCARLTFDEDRERRVGHLADLLDNLLHLRAGADQQRYGAVDDVVRLPQLTRAFLDDDLELVDMPLESELLLLAPAAQVARVDGSAQNRDEIIPVDRLLDEVVGPAAERVQHEIVLSMPG